MQHHMTLVIWFTGLAAMAVVLGTLVLAYFGKPVPDPIWGLGGAAVGSLGTLLTGRLTFGTRSTDAVISPPQMLPPEG